MPGPLGGGDFFDSHCMMSYTCIYGWMCLSSQGGSLRQRMLRMILLMTARSVKNWLRNLWTLKTQRTRIRPRTSTGL